MERVIGAGGIVLVAMVVAGGVQAASMKCARPQEVTAIQASAIQQELMVAALTCHQITNFNAFQTSYNQELRDSDATLLRMFRRLFGGSKGEAQYHAFKTRLANDSSMRSIRDNSDYCREASLVFASALAPDKPTLSDFVSGVQVTEESPVDTCEIRVATGLQGAAIPTIVPQPNPMRVATLMRPAETPAAPAPVAPVAPPARAAASEPGVLPDGNAPAPKDTAAATPPKKSDSGWLSGLF